MRLGAGAQACRRDGKGKGFSFQDRLLRAAALKSGRWQYAMYADSCRPQREGRRVAS
ncbi:hypothetical protein BSLA_01r0405 [Burkholderia stabilis]|nr:hypothetical protein BSLA_01r0405 [Burkholderia stabilis]